MGKPTSSSDDAASGQSRLRNEIVSGALVVTFSLLVLFGLFAYVQAKELRAQSALDALEAIADVQSARAETYVQSGEQALAMIVGRTDLSEHLAELAATGEPSFREAVRDIAVESVNARDDLHSVSVFDAELRLVASSASEADIVDVPESYLAEATRGVVSGLVVPTLSGTTVHLVAGPMIGGEPDGFVLVAQRTEALFDLVVDDVGPGNTGETILAQAVDGEAVLIAPLRYDPSATLQPISAYSRSRLHMESAVNGIETRSTNAVDYRGEPVFAVTRFLGGPGWGLVVKVDRAEAMGALGNLALIAIAGIAAATFIAYVLALRAAKVILSPVRRLTRTAKAIAAGRRDLVVESERDDEIGELAVAFNEMTRQLDTLTADLEQRVADRTRELEERNAQLARIMEDKETFLAGVSHEVRSPLTAMIGFLDLVSESGDSLSSEERTEMLETVSRQAEDVLNLIEDLLASARVEAGTLKVASVRCDLGAQVRQVLEALGPETRVDIEVRGDGVIAAADPARVRQIVRNLLTNADRYGGSNVLIQLGETDGFSSVDVCDDGAGVPEDDRSEIFEPYGQSNAARRIDGSVGLGLHVSRELARLMRGDLEYRYVEGWSVFSLRLPVHIDEPGVTDPEPAELTSSG